MTDQSLLDDLSQSDTIQVISKPVVAQRRKRPASKASTPPSSPAPLPENMKEMAAQVLGRLNARTNAPPNKYAAFTDNIARHMQSLDEDSAFELETIITRNMLEFMAAKRSALSRASSSMSNVTLVDFHGNPITDSSILGTMVVLEASPNQTETTVTGTNEMTLDGIETNIDLYSTELTVINPDIMPGLRPPQPSLQSVKSAFASFQSHVTDRVIIADDAAARGSPAY